MDVYADAARFGDVGAVEKASKLKVLIVASFAPSLRNFRGPLIMALLSHGHEVFAAAPDLEQDSDTLNWLTALGVVCHNVPLSRAGLNPLADLRAMFAMFILMSRIKPDVFLGYTAKPVIWGLIAARFARVPRRVALVTGLGYAFTDSVEKGRGIVQLIARGLYWLALRCSTLVFFQNSDDRADFQRMGLLPPHLPVRSVAGSGIDLDSFPQRLVAKGPFRFLMIARLLADKGIREYVAAAKRLHLMWPQAECHLIGGLDPNPTGITGAEVQAWHMAGDVIWHGHLKDVRWHLKQSTVFVLPSYREGTPRTVLEAMATGRAIITTDAPGCRETVVQGDNGFLVPIRSSDALVQAMLSFINDPALAQHMGQRSRQIAEEKYDVHKVNAVMLREMGL